MARCQMLADVGRRQFLKGGGVAAAGAVAGTAMAAAARAPRRRRRASPIPSTRLANLADLKVNEPLDIAYPDGDSPGVLLKLGRRSRAAPGPTATSSPSRPSARTRASRSPTIAADRAFNCPGHYSRFDAEKGGSGDLGPGDPEPAAVPASGSTTRATSTPRASTS